MNKFASLLIVAVGFLAGCGNDPASSVQYVRAPSFQATTGNTYTMRWRDPTHTKLLIRHLALSEWETQRTQQNWSIAKTVGAVGLLFEYDVASNTATMVEPEQWLTSNEPCTGPGGEPNLKLAWKGSPPEVDIDRRDDLFRLRKPLPNKPDKVTNIGVSGRHYLSYGVAGDRVAIAWCTAHVSRGGLLSGGIDRWGGKLYVEFRSFKNIEKAGPGVKLESAESEFYPPTVLWTWDGSAAVVVDDRNAGFWYVPCPDLSKLQK